MDAAELELHDVLGAPLTRIVPVVLHLVSVSTALIMASSLARLLP